MNAKVRESDWKHFKKIRKLALERMCERALTDVVNTASDSSMTQHERYGAVYEKIKGYDKQIASAFDGLSRSQMDFHLVFMCKWKLIEDSELEPFSEEFKDHLKSWLGGLG